jgi:hypothetical protein
MHLITSQQTYTGKQKILFLTYEEYKACPWFGELLIETAVFPYMFHCLLASGALRTVAGLPDIAM